MNHSKNEINVIAKIEKIILTEIAHSYHFIKEEIANLFPTQFQETGKANNKINLSEIREATGTNPRTESFDYPILEALDNICKEGKAILFDIRFMRNLEYHDLQLCFEIGQAIKTFKNNDIRTEIVRLYSEKPLCKREMSSARNIMTAKDMITKMKEERDAGYESSFGKGETVESQLHRENIEDEINKHRSLINKSPVRVTEKGLEAK